MLTRDNQLEPGSVLRGNVLSTGGNSADQSAGGAVRVPFVIKLAADRVFWAGLEREDLFKLGTARQKLDGLRKGIESGSLEEMESLIDREDPHLVATFLLVCLSTLKEPLIPLEWFRPLVASAAADASP